MPTLPWQKKVRREAALEDRCREPPGKERSGTSSDKLETSMDLWRFYWCGTSLTTFLACWHSGPAYDFTSVVARLLLSSRSQRHQSLMQTAPTNRMKSHQPALVTTRPALQFCKHCSLSLTSTGSSPIKRNSPLHHDLGGTNLRLRRKCSRGSTRYPIDARKKYHEPERRGTTKPVSPTTRAM
eukprot:5116302-Amphidinium_carterae.1